MKSVYSAVRTGSLNKAVCASSLKGYLRTNSNLCHLQHKLIGFYNRDEKCLERYGLGPYINKRVSSVYLTFVYPCIVSINVNDDQKDATFFGLFIYSQSALHVSGDIFVHHQGHLTVFTASDIVHRYRCRLVSWMRWMSSISSTIPAGSNIGGGNHKL